MVDFQCRHGHVQAVTAQYRCRRQRQAGVIVRAIAPGELARDGIYRVNIAHEIAEVEQGIAGLPSFPGRQHDAGAHLGDGGKGPANTT